MTVPGTQDFPDWVTASSPIPLDVVLYDSGVDGEAVPIVTPAIPVTPFTAIVMQVMPTSATVGNVCQVQLVQSTGGSVVRTDTAYALLNTDAGAYEAGVIATIPVFGTSVVAKVPAILDTDKVRLVVTGITQQYAELIKPATSSPVAPSSLKGSGRITSSGVVQIGSIGPWTHGIMGQFTVTQGSGFNVYGNAEEYNAGWTNPRILATGGGSNAPIPINQAAAGLVVQISVQCNFTGNYSYDLSGY